MPVKNKSLIFISQIGCLLPLFIILNLFLGWIFFKPAQWLLIEAILILLFISSSYIFARQFSSSSSKDDDVIDVEGKVVEDKKSHGKMDKI